jgi:DNA-binding HxlR family transcriptional regulator
MPSSSACRIEVVLEVIGDQWNLGIIHELSLGPRRSLDLFASFSGMSTKTLTARLKQLERCGVVARKSYSEAPPKVEYSLTEKGRELLPVLRAVAEVARKWESKSIDSNGAPACRICDAAYGELFFRAETPQADQPPSQPKPRKRTDVTLL